MALHVVGSNNPTGIVDDENTVRETLEMTRATDGLLVVGDRVYLYTGHDEDAFAWNNLGYTELLLQRYEDAAVGTMGRNTDGRIVFAIPYEDAFTLIGTTDRDYEGDPGDVAAGDEEVAYRTDVVSVRRPWESRLESRSGRPPGDDVPRGIPHVPGRIRRDGELPEGVEGGLDSETVYNPPNLTFPFGSYICVVDIDSGTGAIHVVHLYPREMSIYGDLGNTRRGDGALFKGGKTGWIRSVTTISAGGGSTLRSTNGLAISSSSSRSVCCR